MLALVQVLQIESETPRQMCSFVVVLNILLHVYENSLLRNAGLARMCRIDGDSMRRVPSPLHRHARLAHRSREGYLSQGRGASSASELETHSAVAAGEGRGHPAYGTPSGTPATDAGCLRTGWTACPAIPLYGPTQPRQAVGPAKTFC